jgi:putative RecB family exonuclease
MWRYAKMIFSHSKLETYDNCPLKYRLQYIERIRTGRRSIEAFMGSAVHAALEKLYRDMRMSRYPDIEELSGYYLDLWDSTCSDDVFVVRSEYGPEDYRKTGLRCLEDYYRRYHPFEGGVPVWLEKKVTIPIYDPEGRRIEFTGILDRLDCLEGGRYEIHDYKTSSSLPTRQDLERDRQLSLYQLAAEEAFPDAREVDLVWHYLVFDRELRIRRDPGDLKRIAAEAAEKARAIETAVDFPPRESALCDWCELHEHCPKRKHLVMVAGLPECELGTERGVQLADQYVAWSGRKREAEEHMAALKEEILDFAAFQGVDNIQGSSCVLRISRGRLARLPAACSPERDELERVLREAGVWDEVAPLDARKLSSLLKRGDITADACSRVEALLDWEETSTLRHGSR